MVLRISEFVRRVGCLAGCAGLSLGLAAVASMAAAEPAVHFVAPASNETTVEGTVEATPAVAPSTLSVTDEPTSDEAAIETTAESELGEVEGIAPVDLASLASFAQTEAEEIEGEQENDGTRPFRAITQVTINAALPPGVLPGETGPAADDATNIKIPESDDPRFWGGWAQTNYQWSATSLCHRPLYFEEVNAERYGYTVSPLFQPLISGAHFFLTIPTLPYKMVVQHPRECIYTLGYYRAGSPAPRRWHHMDLVWDPTAATVEGLTVTALIFIFP